MSGTERKKKDSISDIFAKAAIAGLVCAGASLFLNPLDVVKVRMQNQVGKEGIKYKGMISGAVLIAREEGLLGLCQGLGPSMWREAFYSTLRLGSYEPIRNLMAGENTSVADTSPLIKYIAALIAGFGGAAIANPFDLLKTRFQAASPTNPLPYSTIWGGIISIHKEGGLAALYKGWVVTASRAAVLTSAQLGSYDTLKNNIMIKHFDVKDGIMLHFGTAMLTGLITTTATNPVDVIKTKFMADKVGKYRNPLHCVALTFKEDGVRGFFRGWTPSYWRVGPHTLFSLLFIERARKFFGYGSM